MQTITGSNLQPTETEFDALVELFNGTRIAQGWSIMPPDEVFPIALAWFQILKQNHIEYAEYPQLLMKAIQYRTAEIREKKRPTPFSIELLLAMKTISFGQSANVDRNAEMERRGFPKITVIRENECLN